MPQYVIERELPGAGSLSPEQLQQISAKSVEVLSTLPDVRWLHSYVTEDRIYCVYEAPDPAPIQEHARCGGFPCTRVSEVKAVIDPSTARVPA